MKPDTYMQRGIVFIVCLTASLSIWAQTPRKPRMQTSASPAETVYKSWEEMQTERKVNGDVAVYFNIHSQVLYGYGKERKIGFQDNIAS